MTNEKEKIIEGYNKEKEMLTQSVAKGESTTNILARLREIDVILDKLLTK